MESGVHASGVHSSLLCIHVLLPDLAGQAWRAACGTAALPCGKGLTSHRSACRVGYAEAKQ